MSSSFERPDPHASSYDPELAARRAAEEEAANARATQMLKRVGIVALVILAFWIGAVLYGFMG